MPEQIKSKVQESKNAPILMSDLAGQVPAHWIILLYSPPFGGKTYFLRGVPTPCRIHDWDGKLEPLYGIPGIEVEQYLPNTFASVTREWQRFKDNWTLDLKNPDIKTLVLEGLSNLDSTVLMHSLKLDGKPEGSKVEIQHYGTHNGELKFFLNFKVSNVRGKNVIVTAHAHNHTDDKTKIMTVQPLITGQKIFDHMPGMFKDVWYLENDHGKRTLHYQTFKRVFAGTLSLTGGGKVLDPTWSKVIAEAEKSKQADEKNSN